MYAQTSVENRTNDRFLTQPRQPRAFGPGADATWAALEADFATYVVTTERPVGRGYKNAARVIGQVSRYALAGLASGLLVYAVVSQLGAADAVRALAGLTFATAWLFVANALVAARWPVVSANLLSAVVLFGLAFAGLPLGVAALVSATGLTVGLGAVLPESQRR